MGASCQLLCVTAYAILAAPRTAFIFGIAAFSALLVIWLVLLLKRSNSDAEQEPSNATPRPLSIIAGLAITAVLLVVYVFYPLVTLLCVAGFVVAAHMIPEIARIRQYSLRALLVVMTFAAVAMGVVSFAIHR